MWNWKEFKELLLTITSIGDQVRLLPSYLNIHVRILHSNRMYSLSLNPETATALDTSLIIYYWLVCNILNEKRKGYVTKNQPKSYSMMRFRLVTIPPYSVWASIDPLQRNWWSWVLIDVARHYDQKVPKISSEWSYLPFWVYILLEVSHVTGTKFVEWARGSLHWLVNDSTCYSVALAPMNNRSRVSPKLPWTSRPLHWSPSILGRIFKQPQTPTFSTTFLEVCEGQEDGQQRNKTHGMRTLSHSWPTNHQGLLTTWSTVHKQFPCLQLQLLQVWLVSVVSGKVLASFFPLLTFWNTIRLILLHSWALVCLGIK